MINQYYPTYEALALAWQAALLELGRKAPSTSTLIRRMYREKFLAETVEGTVCFFADGEPAEGGMWPGTAVKTPRLVLELNEELEKLKDNE